MARIARVVIKPFGIGRGEQQAGPDLRRGLRSMLQQRLADPLPLMTARNAQIKTIQAIGPLSSTAKRLTY